MLKGHSAKALGVDTKIKIEVQWVCQEGQEERRGLQQIRELFQRILKEYCTWTSEKQLKKAIKSEVIDGPEGNWENKGKLKNNNNND